MITILHGEDQLNSRKELERMISEFKGEVRRFEKSVDSTEFYQATSGSLLSLDQLVIVENYLAGKKKLELDLRNISAEVIFWEGKSLPAGVQTEFKKFSGVKIQEYKIPQLIWKFVDCLKPTNGKYLVGLYRETLKTAEAEFIYAMIIRQFRLMLNPEGLPAWQLGKIKSQAKIFSEKQLKLIYQKLLDIDYEIKTGKTPFTLSAKIEMLLLWI